jgi:hypothetical protein
MALTEVQGGPGQPVAGAPAGSPPIASPMAAKFKAAAPVAAGGLAIVLAIIGASTMSGTGADRPLPADTSISTGMSSGAATSAPADPAAAPRPIDPAANPPVVNVPPPQGAIPSVAFDQAPPAAAGDMEIVVKFKDDAKVKDIIDAFWKDKASATAKFDALKAKRPEFASLKLDRVTYSNELVLVHDGANAPAGRLAAMRAAATKLGAAADISYAEPNMTAHPGGQ